MNNNDVTNIYAFLRENPDRPCFLNARDLCELGTQLVQNVRDEFEREQKVLAEKTEDELLTPEAVMAIAKISRATLYRIAKAGILLPIWVGGQRRWHKHDLDTFLKQRR